METLTVRLDKETYHQIHADAAALDVSRSAYVRALLYTGSRKTQLVVEPEDCERMTAPNSGRQASFDRLRICYPRGTRGYPLPPRTRRLYGE